MENGKLIAIFATEISSRVQCEIFLPIFEEAKKYGYNLVFFSGSYDKIIANKTADVAPILYNLSKNMDFAAFFICAQSIGNVDMIKQIIKIGHDKNIPVFAYDCENVGISSKDGVIAINPDYKQGFATGVRHLIECHNCKNIFMLAGIEGNKYSDDRIEMYKKEMREHGLTFTDEYIGYGNFWEIPAAEAVNKFLDSDLPKPDAICCANDAMAIVAAKTLEERGYKVPEDVLITGFDGIEDGKYNYPTISTCEFNLVAVAKFVFDSINGKNDAVDYLIPLNFYAKESCGCSYDNVIENRKEMVRMIDGMKHSYRQSHMLSAMQVELIDSCMLEDNVGFINGALGLFSGYSHLLCVRDDIEIISDYTTELEKLRIHLNYNFLSEDTDADFNVTDIVPDWNGVVKDLNYDDILAFKLINSAEKVYGYIITKTNKIISNELRLLGNFMEGITNVIETTLRNYRLKQANDKLSEMYDRMAEIYIRDTMTGLYNRHGYYKVLEDYIKRPGLKDRFVHIISIDMDGMKYINDNFGHYEGDNAIKAVATAINDCFAQPCVSARFGGDEFVVALFADTADAPTVGRLSEKINSYLASLPMLYGKPYTVGVSIGKAEAKVSEIVDFKSLEKLADEGMYQNKRSRKKNSRNA